MKDLGRLITAMVTPFDDAGRVDLAQARKLALALINSGSDGLVVCGTTGETPTLSNEEKLGLFREVKSAVAGKGSVIANVGNYNTAESVEMAREAGKIGVDGCLTRHVGRMVTIQPYPLASKWPPATGGSNMPRQAVVTIGDKQWRVNLTTTYQELVTGLGGLPSIPAATGMLFDMGAEGRITVTTVPMLFPLDLVFISSSMLVTEVVAGMAPGLQVISDTPARYFLEVNAAEAADVKVGAPVTVQVYQAPAAVTNPITVLMSQLVGVAGAVLAFGLMFGIVRTTTRAVFPRPEPGERPATYGPEGASLVNRGANPCAACLSNPGNPGSAVLVDDPPPETAAVEARRRRGLPPGTRIELITPEEAARIRELRDQGLNYREISERTGRSMAAVWRIINQGFPALRRAITPQRLQEVTTLRRLGLTLEEVGKRLGITRSMVLNLLYRVGERLDLTAEAQRVRRSLSAVSDSLGPAATLDKLRNAADRLRDIADDAALLLEIMPQEVAEPMEYPFDLGWIHGRALMAEEVLRTGTWCLLRQREETLPRVRQRLRACAEASRDAAVGIIENWEGYATKATQVIFEVEEMMEEEA